MQRIKRAVAGFWPPAGTAGSWIGAGAIVVGGHVTTALIGIVALRLLTELAPKEVFGTASLVLTVLGLLQHFAVAPFSATLLRYHTQAGSHEVADATTGEALAWSLAGSAAMAVIVCAVLAIGPPKGMVLGAAGIAASAAWLVVNALKTVVVSRLQAEQRRSWYTAALVIDAVLMAALPALALLIVPSSDAYIAGQAGAAAAAALIVTVAAPWSVLGSLRLPRLGTPFIDKVRGYGSTFVTLAILGFVANLADRYVLAGVMGPAAVGQYLAAFAIASRGMALGNATLTDLFRPVLFQAENESQSVRAGRLFTKWMAVNVAMSLTALAVIALLGDYVARLLLAEPYRDGAVAIMMWITLGYGINGLTQVIENRLLSLHVPRRLLVPLATGGAANLAASLVLVPMNGIVGAAQASCASFAFQLAVTALLLHWTIREAKPV